MAYFGAFDGCGKVSPSDYPGRHRCSLPCERLLPTFWRRSRSCIYTPKPQRSHENDHGFVVFVRLKRERSEFYSSFQSCFRYSTHKTARTVARYVPEVYQYVFSRNADVGLINAWHGKVNPDSYPNQSKLNFFQIWMFWVSVMPMIFGSILLRVRIPDLHPWILKWPEFTRLTFITSPWPVIPTLMIL